jgi:hypothetical protein
VAETWAERVTRTSTTLRAARGDLRRAERRRDEAKVVFDAAQDAVRAAEEAVRAARFELNQATEAEDQ